VQTVQPVQSRMHTLLLPEALDLTVAATLAETLLDCRGDDVVIDASYVRRLTAQCAQVLRSAVETWKADQRSLTVVNGSPAIMERLSPFGIPAAAV